MPETKKCFNCDRTDIELGLPHEDFYPCRCRVCGEFKISGTAHVMANKIPRGKRWLLSKWIREQNEVGEVPLIDERYEQNVFAHIQEPSIERKLEGFLLRLGHKSQYGGDRIQIDPQADYPLYFASNDEETWWIASELRSRGFVDDSGSSMGSISSAITGAGWNRIEKLKRDRPESQQIFVAMWFELPMDEIFEEGFRKAIESEEVGYRALRIDKKEHANKIDDEIVLEIRRSRAVVADFTGNRGGVYFEAGFALGLGIPVIWTCRNSDIGKVHFDTRQYNHITWENSKELREKLKNRILALGI